MRYSLIAALVGVVAAVPLTETIYNTQVYTITSCGAEVTDCPGRKTSSVAPVSTTSCTEEQSWTAPPVYYSSTTPVVTPVPSSEAPAPPPYKPTSEAPAPPPYKQSSTPAAAPSSKVTSKPAMGTGAPSASTGVLPSKTTSVTWSQTSSPAKYTGAASQLNVAGAMVGAGALAALFL